MKRLLPFLLIALAASLSGGCASTPSQSATQALASDILSGASEHPTCAYGEIPRCMTTGTRINSLNPQASCECLVREIAVRAP